MAVGTLSFPAAWCTFIRLRVIFGAATWVWAWGKGKGMGRSFFSLELGLTEWKGTPAEML